MKTRVSLKYSVTYCMLFLYDLQENKDQIKKGTLSGLELTKKFCFVKKNW